MNLDDLLRTLAAKGGSDLLLKGGLPPMARLNGDLSPLGETSLSAEQVRSLCLDGLTGEQKTRFEQERELDFALSVSDAGRFRGNVYFQRGQVGGVFRAVPMRIHTLEELRLPPVCRYFAERPRGLVLVSGPAGSGKTTTLASLIDYINRIMARHVITVEDPIEFVHENKKSLVNQREIGRDTHSYAGALRDALRQDPDVIVLGELADAETVSLALAAAEMGHLVFGVLHTTDTPQTIDRLVDIFPPHQQPQVRAQLATHLIGVVAQTLVKAKDGTGRVAAYETLVGVPSVKALIRDGKTHQMSSVISTGSKQGMITLDQSLATLVNKGLVNYDDALTHAHNLTEFHFLSGQDEAPSEDLTADPTSGHSSSGAATSAPSRTPAR